MANPTCTCSQSSTKNGAIGALCGGATFPRSTIPKTKNPLPARLSQFRDNNLWGLEATIAGHWGWRAGQGARGPASRHSWWTAFTQCMADKKDRRPHRSAREKADVALNNSISRARHTPRGISRRQALDPAPARTVQPEGAAESSARCAHADGNLKNLLKTARCALVLAGAPALRRAAGGQEPAWLRV